jgi:hypothetical protein
MVSPAVISRRSGTRTRAKLTLAVATLLAVAALPGVADAGDSDPEAERSRAEQELADRYAPIVTIKAQTGPCDTGGEAFRPASVEIVLDNPEVLLRQVGRSDPVMTAAPSASDLFELGEGFYLDFPGDALAPGCIYERDFDRYDTGMPPTVYAHVARQDDRPNQLALQYWTYWYFNDWNNKHESDWEGIQLLFDVGTVEEALETEPVSVGYAQHEGGERADWDSSKLERDGNRPVVYSSAGSHASYFGSALYIGRSASEGFGCDDTDGPSVRIDPDTVVLPDSVDDADDPLAWSSFEGRWGERHDGAFNGPTGPVAKDRWTRPIDWHDDLRSDSAVVPSGDSQADVVISAFCGIVEWGSSELIKLTTNPTRFLFSLAIPLLAGWWLVRRTVWTRTEPTPLVRRRRAGQIIRTSIGMYRHRPGALIAVGLIYLPVTLTVGAIAALAAQPPAARRFFELADDVIQTRVAVAHLLGALASIVAYVAVNATVAALYVLSTEGEPRAVSDAIRNAWGNRRPIAIGFVRAAAVVIGLALTIVGIPWAVRQLIRYQFTPQVVVLEGRDGRSALARSTDLVRGRWWYIAFMMAMFNLFIGVSVLVIGLLLLIALSGLPFWLYTALIAVVYALVVPLAAVAQTLLYGDSVAAHEDTLDDRATGSATSAASSEPASRSR